MTGLNLLWTLLKAPEVGVALYRKTGVYAKGSEVRGTAYNGPGFPPREWRN